MYEAIINIQFDCITLVQLYQSKNIELRLKNAGEDSTGIPFANWFQVLQIMAVVRLLSNFLKGFVTVWRFDYYHKYYVTRFVLIDYPIICWFIYGNYKSVSEAIQGTDNDKMEFNLLVGYLMSIFYLVIFCTCTLLHYFEV